MKNILVVCGNFDRIKYNMGKVMQHHPDAIAYLSNNRIVDKETEYIFTSLASDVRSQIRGMEFNELQVYEECLEIPPDVLQEINSRIKKENK